MLQSMRSPEINENKKVVKEKELCENFCHFVYFFAIRIVRV